jgi:hypothetical protein
VLPNDDYRRLVRELLVHRGLSRRPRSARLALREEDRAWAASVSERWVQVLSGRGYDVIGDLEDLLADADAAPFVDPDRPDEGQVAEVAVEAIEALLLEAARLRTVEDGLRAELAATREALENGGVVRRVKRRLVEAAEHHRLAAIGLALYRRVRGSSSRSV